VQGIFINKDEYSIISLLDLASKLAGLALSVYGAIGFCIGYYQQFVVDKSMLKMLYQEHDCSKRSEPPFMLQ
jgi:hypothetical protein